MARIPGVSTEAATSEVRQVYEAMLHGLGQLTGREMPAEAAEQMIAPLRMYAHVPGLLQGYVALEGATAQVQVLDKRIQALAELKAATLVQCEYCIDLGSQISRQWGLSDEELLALPFYRSSPLFNEVEKLVLDYATGMCRTPVEVSGELVAALRSHFSDAQIVTLTHLIALENLRGRFDLALGIGAAGFSEGMVCAVPALAEMAGAGR